MTERHNNPTNSEGFQPQIIAEGKTKIIWTSPHEDLVLIESKDDITAGDGVRHDKIDGKGKLSTETTANVFGLLERNEISTHFIYQNSPTTFEAKKVDMVPLECSARGFAYGSYLKRHPDIRAGERLRRWPVEFYFKDDENHDPIISLDMKNDGMNLYDAKEPIATREPMGRMSFDTLGITPRELVFMQTQTKKVAKILFREWGKMGITLVDVKIEFGRDSEGNLIVADVIDNDSWRIWVGGDPQRALDKQNYRDQSKSLEEIYEDYVVVMQMSKRFRRLV